MSDTSNIIHISFVSVYTIISVFVHIVKRVYGDFLYYREIFCIIGRFFPISALACPFPPVCSPEAKRRNARGSSYRNNCRCESPSDKRSPSRKALHDTKVLAHTQGDTQADIFQKSFAFFFLHQSNFIFRSLLFCFFIRNKGQISNKTARLLTMFLLFQYKKYSFSARHLPSSICISKVSVLAV